MARHGRLCQRIHSSCARIVLRSLCALIAIVGNLCWLQAETADEGTDWVDIHLRYQWEAPERGHWHIDLRLEDAATASSISHIENHSPNPIAGSLEQTDARSLLVQPRLAIKSGAIEFRVQAPSTANLVIAVQTAATSELSNKIPLVKKIALADLLTGAVMNEFLGALGSWSLSRTAGDELRIEGLSSTIFPPGTPLEFKVRTQNFTRHAKQLLTLHYSFYQVSHGETVVTHRQPIQVDPRGNSKEVVIKETTPTAPGVYEVRCEVVQEDDDVWSRLRRREEAVVRASQPFIVFDPLAPSADSGDTTWQSIGVIRPSESSWSVGQWLPKQTTRLLPGVSASPEQAELAKQEYAGELVSLLEPSGSFQATLPVKSVGSPHRVTLRYPTSSNAKIRIEIGQAGSPVKTSSFVLSTPGTSDSGPMWATHTFVHYPSGDDQIWLTNLDSSAPTAIESVAVEAGPNRLITTLPINKERAAVLRLTSIDWVDQFTQDIPTRYDLSRCDAETVALIKLWNAIYRLQEYAIASGMNGVMLPAAAGSRAWFATDRFHSQQVADLDESQRLNQFLQLMQSCDLDVYVSLSPNMPLSRIESELRQNSSMLQSLVRGSGNKYNLLHPAIQEQLGAVIGDLERGCREFDNYAGVMLDCGENTHTQPLRLANDSSWLTDPATLALFAHANQRIVSPQLEAWVANEGKLEFSAWIDAETNRALASICSTTATGKCFVSGDALRNSTDANLIVATDFKYEAADVINCPQRSLQQQFSVESSPAGPPIIATLDQKSCTVETSELVREPLLMDVGRITDRFAPQMLVIAQPLLGTRLSDELARILRSFSALPQQPLKRIEPVDPAAQTIHVSTTTSGGHLYVLLVNLTPWENDVDWECSAPVEWEVIGNDDPSVVSTKDTRTRATLAASQLMLLKSRQPVTDIRIKSWLGRVSGGGVALEQIKSQVTSIVESIGILSDLKPTGVLQNGGFEEAGGMGLVGWLHAQYPPGCVRVDDEQAAEGIHSVLLTTDESVANRTWLVSETVDPPRTGRLAVSLAYRGEKAEETSPHRIREATRSGVPIRFSNEFEVPRNGQWGDRELVLEAEDLGPHHVETLRLTIDSLSGGRVWIDDVRLHDHFPTSKERAELQRQAFLAVQGLQRGNLTPSASLLQNDWARHLLALPPSEKQKPVIERVHSPDEPLGVAERIRSWIPRPLRF
jgi:hypothetical protein